MDDTPVITLDRITFAHASGPPLFSDLSFSFIQGMFYLITGPSGAGKSSLLRLISHLDSPATGEILYKDTPMSAVHPPALRQEVLYIHQTPMAISGTVRDNLLLPFSFKINKGKPVPDDPALEDQLEIFMVTGVGLEDEADTLSVGQLQRICLIRGLLLEPRVLLLDEPTSALDPKSREIVEAAVERFVAEKDSTVIMISHNDFTPRQTTPITLTLNQGRIYPL